MTQGRPATLLIGAGLLAVVLAGGGVYLSARHEGSAEPRALLDRYCVGCHNDAERAGGVALDGATLDLLSENRDVFEHAIRKVRTGFMPPAGEPRPERAALDRFAATLEHRLDAAARAAPNPGYKGVSRLNRAEYANAVRDLSATTRAVAATLPADDAIQGFDNVAAASPCRRRSSRATSTRRSRSAAPPWATARKGRRRSATRSRRPASGARRRATARHARGLRGHAQLSARRDLRDPASEHAAPGGAAGGQLFCAAPRIDVTLDGERLAVDDPAAFRLRMPAGRTR